MASAFVVIVLLLFVIFHANVAQHQSKSISIGSSLSPSREPMSWDSPSSNFKFGFYKQGSGFLVGIWLVTSPDITIVWTANRDDPPVSSNSTLTLTKDGKLILITDQNEEKTIFKIFDSAASASMFDSGNFVFFNNRSGIICSSFNFPTDTILEGQNLLTGCELFSSASESNHSTGRYRLKMQNDGNLVSYPINTIDKYSEAYWASGTNNNWQLHLYLNSTGDLFLLNETLDKKDSWNAKSPFDEELNSSTINRATLGPDGIFCLFVHYLVTESGQYNTSNALWSMPEDQCQVKSFCGLNS